MDNNYEENQKNAAENQVTEDKVTEEQQNVYKDPNEDVFQSRANTGNAQEYQYGASYQETNTQYRSAVNATVQEDTSPLSMGEWLLTLLIAMVPCIGLIVYLVWAFDRSGNVNRKNFCRAYLILQVISVALVTVMLIFTLLFNVVY